MYIPDYENPYAIWKDVERIFSAIATDESVMPCYDQQLADGWESLLCLFCIVLLWWALNRISTYIYEGSPDVASQVQTQMKNAPAIEPLQVAKFG